VHPQVGGDLQVVDPLVGNLLGGLGQVQLDQLLHVLPSQVHPALMRDDLKVLLRHHSGPSHIYLCEHPVDGLPFIAELLSEGLLELEAVVVHRGEQRAQHLIIVWWDLGL